MTGARSEAAVEASCESSASVTATPHCLQSKVRNSGSPLAGIARTKRIGAERDGALGLSQDLLKNLFDRVRRDGKIRKTWRNFSAAVVVLLLASGLVPKATIVVTHAFLDLLVTRNCQTWPELFGCFRRVRRWPGRLQRIGRAQSEGGSLGSRRGDPVHVAPPSEAPREPPRVARWRGEQERACCRYQSLVLYLLVQRGSSWSSRSLPSGVGKKDAF
jgi:hypothetical protein